MTLRDLLRPVADEVRSIPGRLGLREFTATVIVRRWTGERPGIGESYDTEHPIKLPGDQNPKVRQMNPKDVIASGGDIQFARYVIGPFTPPYPALSPPYPNRAPFIGGGEETTTLDPPTQDEVAQEIFYRIAGPGLPSPGMLCKKVSQQFDRATQYTIIVDATGVAG